ncbi:MAG TPA: transcription elongation factor GreA [Coriobacteriia bacterium]
MHREIALTAEGQHKLEEELHFLETVKRREVGERIKEAKEFGDISENSEYDDAKNEQAWVESRIIEVNQILAHATIIAAPKKNDKVSLGSKVDLQAEGENDTIRYHIVGSAEADPANAKISNESPVGQAVIGSKKGDVVPVVLPSGKTISYTVVSIHH